MENLESNDAVSNSLPSRVIPISADVELRVQALDPRTTPGVRQFDIRLFRRDVSGTAMSPTNTGMHCPVRLAGLVADAIRVVGVRTAEQHAFTPHKDGPPPPEVA